jgi:Pyruvate/2-oxoacid:ferredoxin oxidoreductase delta subunit
VPLDCDFLGRRLRSPFILASPYFTVGYAQARRAYEAGWAGAVMSVSSREECQPDALGRLGEDVERLRREFPDRLTLAPGECPVEGDPSSYRAAAELLAHGARAVRIDALATRHGLGVVNELHAGLSWYLAELGLRSVSELIGCAPALDPALPGELASGKAARIVKPELCSRCGSCARCPDLAITPDAKGIPAVDPARCTGCGLCAEQCVTGALANVPRARVGP